MNIFSIPTFVTSFLTFMLGFFSFSKNVHSSINRSFYFLCLSVTTWLFLVSISYNCSSQFLADFFLRICYLGIVNIPTTVFHFTVTFLGVGRLKKVIFPVYLLGIIFSFFILKNNFIINGVYKYFWGYYPKAGLFHPLFLIFFMTTTGFCFVLLIIYFLKSQVLGIKRQQIKYIILAFIFLSLASFDFISNYGISFYPIGYIPTTIFLGIITYSIIRYRLLNITTLIARTTIFVFVYSFVLGIPFILAFGWQEKLIVLLGASWWIVPLICSTILATVGPFIYLYIDRKAEDRLLKEQRSYQNVLRNASSGMIRIKDLKRLLNLIVHVVTKTVKIKHASVYLLDQENNSYVLLASRRGSDISNVDNFIDAGTPLVWQLITQREPIVTEEAVMKLRDEPQSHGLSKFVEQLVNLKASLVVPSFVDDKLIGILLLGEKLSGKLYSEDDINVFSVLANQAALAIENAQFYDEVKKTHEQLFQAEKLATIGTMADGLSHQINNRFHALSLIAGDSLDLLKTFDWTICNEETKKIFTDLRDALERIESNVLQGGEVVKGLLKYSRPGEGGFQSIDFKDVLNGAIDMVQYKIKLKEIDLVQNISSEIPKLYGNLTQLQEVFFNMIDNAYDAIKERQILLKEEGYRGKIEVSAFGRDNSLEITVADNGMGVKDLDKKKLFTPFFTTKATAKKGTGLGLYVIDKIIISHNGKLNMDSVYQSGTRFTITLPISAK